MLRLVEAMKPLVRWEVPRGRAEVGKGRQRGRKEEKDKRKEKKKKTAKGKARCWFCLICVFSCIAWGGGLTVGREERRE